MAMGKLRFSRKTAAVGAVMALSPLMIMSLASLAPSADECIIYAAEFSARLAAGEVFSGDAAGIVPDDEDLPLDKPEEVYNAYLSFDDSFMISSGELFIPSGENEELEVSEEHDTGAEPYPESIESHDGVIEAMTYGFYRGDDYVNLDGGGQVRNVTSVSNDALLEESRKGYDFVIEKNGEPQVLIMHTHETESYEPYRRDFYDSSFTSRTTDDSMNMAAVGDEIAAQLENAGIGVIHDVTKHDYPSYNNSYDRSRITVQEILEEYPSIKVVLDIHRDAIEREDGTRIAPTIEINGKNAAQIMIISGCDDGTMDMPNYMENFRFTAALQQQLEKDYPGLARPVLFDYRKYNQDLTTGSILIEVGGHANSIDEALYSGELIGKALVNLFEDT
ncbi:MAG: stage II sporulation protein P [Oscillospiraceae bacterium]|nr:stage II sporulation protein P [Oscillospiraceae bacterium]